MKKAREKEERWKKERREEVERKRGRDLPLPLLHAHARAGEQGGEQREEILLGERCVLCCPILSDEIVEVREIEIEV